MRVATWNAEGMFSEGHGTIRANAADAIRTLRALDASVVVIPEFAIQSRLLPETKKAIRNMGYTLSLAEYIDERATGLLFAVLTKTAPSAVKLNRFKDSERFALSVTVEHNNKMYNIIGVHLDDRSEDRRIIEVDSLNKMIVASEHPIVLMGDFNAMDGDSIRARLLRSWIAGLAARFTPSRDGLSIGQRLVGMADGRTIRSILHTKEVRNVSGSSSTISAKQRGLELLPATPLVKIDWIFASSDISAQDVKVWSDVGSDHRPIVAELN